MKYLHLYFSQMACDEYRSFIYEDDNEYIITLATEEMYDYVWDDKKYLGYKKVKFVRDHKDNRSETEKNNFSG